MDPIVAQAVKRLKDGEPICFPTETVYALAADAANDKAVEAIYQLKGRRTDLPLSLMVPSYESASLYGRFSPKAKRLAARYWPGPLTLIVPQGAQRSALSPRISVGIHTIGIRVPDHPVAQQILQTFDAPIVATSVNPSGLPAACSASDIRRYYADQLYIVEGCGDDATGLASTVLDVTGDAPCLLREGVLTEADLRSVWESEL